MAYVFKSKATADLVMLKPQAERILRLLGREPAPQGILEASALPAAIAALDAAVAEARTRAREAAEDASDASDANDTKGDDEADLGRRAWPFVDMLRRASAAGADVVWGV